MAAPQDPPGSLSVAIDYHWIGCPFTFAANHIAGGFHQCHTLDVFVASKFGGYCPGMQLLWQWISSENDRRTWTI
jgi:predicted transcriptional regulator